jgi:hypothetical protein
MKNYDISLDSQFDAIEGLTWKPWVGKDYLNSDNKVLLIGESHYGTNGSAINLEQRPNFTRDYINNRCLGNLSEENKQEHKFFSNTIKVIGNSESGELRQNIWFNAAFYNFVQRPLTDVKKRPQTKDFRLGWEVLEDVLDVVQPSYCIFLGVAAASSFQKKYLRSWKTKGVITKGKPDNNTYGRIMELEKNEKRVQSVFVRHPSSFFSWKKWHQFMKIHIPTYIDNL